MDIKDLKGYTEWMKGFGTGVTPGCSYDLHSASWDEGNRTAIFFATFHGTHS